MKKVAVITSGYMPVPASKGGAVETLDSYLISENEIEYKCQLEVFSCYDYQAEETAKTLKNTVIRFIITPKIINFLDLIIYKAVKILKPHSKTISYRYILRRLYFIGKVAKILSAEDYDEVMIENHATLLMAMKKHDNYEKYKGRFIYHLHNEQKKLYGCENVLKNVKVIATVSEYVASCIKKQVPFLTEEQVTVLRNCVDSQRFRSDQCREKSFELRKKYNICDEELVVLYTGRLSPEKGIKELLSAFSEIDNVNAKLVIAGGYFSGDSSVKNVYENELRAIAGKIGEKIIFTGYVDYADMPAIYSMADIVVIPSIWNDSAPLTVIETVTCGVPLITTRSGGIPEYITEECAVLLERDEKLVENLKNSIVSLLCNKDKRNDMSNASLALSANWGIPKYYREFIELI